jgi:hypothetical protein
LILEHSPSCRTSSSTTAEDATVAEARARLLLTDEEEAIDGEQGLQGVRARARRTDAEPAATTNDGDGLLPEVTLTATAIARGEAIEREVKEAMAEELREQRRLTNAGRPDCHGGVLFVGPRFPT